MRVRMQVRAVGRASSRPADRAAALLAGAVGPVVEPGPGRVDLGELVPGVLHERADLRALEGDGRALRVVLVVGVGVPRRLDDPGVVAGEVRQPLRRTARRSSSAAAGSNVMGIGQRRAARPASRLSAMIRRWISEVPSKILVSRASRQ